MSAPPGRPTRIHSADSSRASVVSRPTQGRDVKGGVGSTLSRGCLSDGIPEKREDKQTTGLNSGFH